MKDDIDRDFYKKYDHIMFQREQEQNQVEYDDEYDDTYDSNTNVIDEV